MTYRLLHSILFLLIITGCSNIPLKTLQSEIDEMIIEFVPDKRTGITTATIYKQDKSTILIKGETIFPDAKEKIVSHISNFGFRVADSINLLPDYSVGDKSWGLVCVSVANIRASPSHSSELTTQAVMGTPVRIFKRQSGWLLLQTPDYYIGWTNTSSVSLFSDSEIQSWKQSERLIFTGLHGIVYENDNDDSRTISDLVAGTIVTRLAESGNSIQILLPDSRTGFVKKGNLGLFDEWASNIKATKENVISVSEQFIGLPYLWGGTSSKALDCSGFTKTVYFLNGIILERDASQQIKHGLEVSAVNNFNLFEKGDLLFFGTHEPFRVVHVGIWMGDTEIIHASGMVKIESMNPDHKNFSNYLHDTFIGRARRIIGEENNNGIWPVKSHSWYF